MRIGLLFALLAGCHSKCEAQADPVAATRLGDLAQWRRLDQPFLAARISAVGDERCAVSRAGQVACWGDLTNHQAGPVEIKAGLTTPRLLAGIEGATDVVTNWFFVCVAQRAGAGPGRCFATRDVGFKVPQFPSPPVELGAGPRSPPVSG